MTLQEDFGQDLTILLDNLYLHADDASREKIAEAENKLASVISELEVASDKADSLNDRIPTQYDKRGVIGLGLGFLVVAIILFALTQRAEALLLILLVLAIGGSSWYALHNFNEAL